MTPTDEALARIEAEYDMPAVDVIRYEAYCANYPLKRVASDLGLSEDMLRRTMAKHGIEWNREKIKKPTGNATHYAMHVIGE